MPSRPSTAPPRCRAGSSRFPRLLLDGHPRNHAAYDTGRSRPLQGAVDGRRCHPVTWRAIARLIAAERVIAALFLTVLASQNVWGQSPLVAELSTWAARYHEDPSRIDMLRTGLAAAVTRDS